MKLTAHRHDDGALTIHADRISPRITAEQLVTTLASALLRPPAHESDPESSSSADVDDVGVGDVASRLAEAVRAGLPSGSGVTPAAAVPAPVRGLRVQAEHLLDQGLDDEAVCAALGISRAHMLRLDDPSAGVDVDAASGSELDGELDEITAQLRVTVGSPDQGGAT